MNTHCNYQKWFVRRDDDGYITECAVYFWEGEVSTQNEEFLKLIVPVNRYRMANILPVQTKKTVKNHRGEDVSVYYPEDFGKIKTDDELHSFLNKELDKMSKKINKIALHHGNINS